MWVMLHYSFAHLGQWYYGEIMYVDAGFNTWG
jgi:enoyl-[acyl-carrier-protein] reductase (NADH)